jgi:aminodeoxyfutalosine deaminase
VDISPFVAALPKTELHLHLVGAAPQDTVLQLARRHPEIGVPTEPAAMAEFYRFRDFGHFIETYAAVDRLVRTADDVHALVLGLARDATRSNVRYAEVTVTAAMHLEKGISPEVLAATLSEARRAARDELGITLNWIFDIPAGFGEKRAADTVDFALRYRPEGTVALGLAGMEDGEPRAKYRPWFEEAREQGMHRVAHAGETTGAEEVWGALRALDAERIGHGVGAASDPELLRYLADHQIPVEVCPTSNVCLKAVGDIASHPLPTLLRAGVPVTLSTDDPGMFDTTLDGEYAQAQRVFGLDDAALADIARAGVRAAYCEEDLRAGMLGEIEMAENRASSR